VRLFVDVVIAISLLCSFFQELSFPADQLFELLEGVVLTNACPLELRRLFVVLLTWSLFPRRTGLVSRAVVITHHGRAFLVLYFGDC
jgi:hypothetical protein